MAVKSGRPQQSEYAPYYGGYVGITTGDDAVALLESELQKALAFYGTISEEQSKSAYAAGKWTIRQVLGHIVDGERVFGYRALVFARGDKAQLPSFEQDDYVATANSNATSLADHLKQFEHLRRANILMLRDLSMEAWSRVGVASGKEISVRALAFILAGHEMHHRKVLGERYSTSAATTVR